VKTENQHTRQHSCSCLNAVLRLIKAPGDIGVCFVQLRGAYQDQHCLYMLMEWVPGGELFHYIDLHHSFNEETARFYAANVLLALEFLHAKGIIYRDLKPENLVVDATGYLKLADFGFAKHVGSSRAFTICGTPDYQAPEVIMRRGATKAVDYWAVGVLMFEMLVGEPPFMSATNDPWDTFRRAITGRCHVPSFVSESATDLIYRLLQVPVTRNLGDVTSSAAALDCCTVLRRPQCLCRLFALLALCIVWRTFRRERLSARAAASFDQLV
jgi:serine/threonine protein kinase